MKIKLLRDLPGAKSCEIFVSYESNIGNIGITNYVFTELISEGFAEEVKETPDTAFDGTLIEGRDGYYVDTMEHEVEKLCKESSDIDYTCFSTKEQAQEWHDRQMALWRLKKWVAENDNGFVPDWSNEKQKKWIIHGRDGNKLDIEYYCFLEHNPDFPYMSSEEIAERCMKECEDDLNIYFRKK